jgi:FkbM family methyltransferase
MNATVEMVPTLINGRWELLLPEHRALRPEWPWWEATRLAAMAHHIGPGDVVWDVGAEEGDFPALWASWGAQVVLAEPNPKVWPNIRAIFEANYLEPPALCWPGFLGDQVVDGERDYDGTGPWPASSTGPVIGDHGFCQLNERPDLPAATVDALVADGVPAPTVITMDVEGSELHVLQGAAATLHMERPTVFVSVHPTFMREQYGQDPDELYAFMDEVDYERVFLTEDHERHEMFLPR